MGVPYRLKVIDRNTEAARPSGIDGHVSGAESGDASDDLSPWVLATAPRAIAYATSLLRDRERAEDVVQDCYCRLLAKADVYDLRVDGLKLLLAAISNACINLKTRRRGVFSLLGKEGRPAEVEDRSAREPGGSLLDRELAEAIGRGLAALPVRQRAAIELKSQGHSLQEVAEILRISPSNAGVLVHRARAAMESLLAPYLGDREP
ncbi:MAG: RNA polymerase sigma factor [Isosphaeraceae bacterium]|nr:RNA polymerase sigma factor [Isosphaeraceae bacterium]